MKSSSTLAACRIFAVWTLTLAAMGGAPGGAQTAKGDLPSPPLISVVATHPRTHEPFCDPVLCDAATPAPGVFTLSRQGGDLSQELFVSLKYVGTAENGVDYEKLVEFVNFPAGKASLEVFVQATFDRLNEGEETVELEIQPDPSLGPIERYRVDKLHATARVIIEDTGGVGSPWPVVSLRATRFSTAEPCPVCRIAPGVLTVSRDGKLTDPLTVYLDYDGSATPGQDYQELPIQVVIPAGESSVDLMVAAYDDEWVEGPEIVRARISLPEFATRGYDASAEENSALVVIGDNEKGAPLARMDIIDPIEGTEFAPRVTVPITVLGAWMSGELAQPIRFFANGQLIGTVVPPPTLRPFIEGLPSEHTLWWTNPPPGRYTLSAETQLTAELKVVSTGVNITVGDPTEQTLVRIDATRRIAEETSAPLRRLPLRGEFTLSRRGPTTTALKVFVHYSGTSTPGQDAQNLPFLVTIPAGESSTSFDVVPVVDNLLEGIETLVATLSNCPPDTDPPMGIPCYGGYEIDPVHDHAVVFIREDGISRASIVITAPQPGQTLRQGSPIQVKATAVDLEGAMTHVDFFDGDSQIGESTIVFIRPPDPGTPIFHQFEWKDALPGAHVLTARGLDSNGETVKSEPVSIHVLGEPEVPTVTVTTRDGFGVEPRAGAELDVAAFRVRRTGALDEDLTVAYSLRGAAENGIDYEKLPGWVTIPKGRRSVLVTATPIQDRVKEPRETVILKLEGPLTDQFPPPYRVGTPAQAIAILSDEPWIHPHILAECSVLPDGFTHVCFVADPQFAYRVEASTDLRKWDPIFHGVPVGDALHVVEETGKLAHRFYRLIAEAGAPEE